MEPSHQSHEYYGPKTISQHFQPKLMEGNERGVWEEMGVWVYI